MSSLGSEGQEDETLRVGLLMEAAQAQQGLAESVLDRLDEHVRGIDAIVRDEVKRTLVEQWQVLGEDARRTAETLKRVGRAANLRVLLWSVGITTLCTAIPAVEAWWVLPSRDEIAGLMAKRDQLTAQVERLRWQGGRADLRKCGAESRLCIKVDRKAPPYGEAGDYRVIEGY